MGATASRARVVFVNRYFHPDLSATSQMLSHVACALAGRGLDVHVVASRQLYEDAGARLRQRDVCGGVDVHRVGSTSFGRASALGRLLDYLSFHAAAAVWLLRWLRRGDVVVAKTDPPLLSVTAAGAALLRGATLVNWLQDLFPEVAERLHGAGANRALAPLQALRDWSLRRAALNVAIGSRMRDYLLERGVAADLLRVIPNTVAWGGDAPLPTAASLLRARLGDSGKFVVAYSGNLGRAHDVEALLDCLGRLSTDEAIRFLLVGGGTGMLRLRAEAERQDWGHATFLPYQDEGRLRDSLAAADVHLVSLLPAMEGLIVPSKAYGVMAAGRPLVFIGDPDGEIARTVLATGCGALVPPGDGAALAATLRSLAADSVSRASMGRRGRAAFVEQFGPQRVVAAWIDALRRVAPRLLA